VRKQKRLVQCIAAMSVFLVSQAAVAADATKASLQTVTLQFQQATAAVITSAQTYFAQMNTVEQNGALDEIAFERKPLDNTALDNIQIISPEALKARTDALKAISQYTQDLASLATGSSLKTFGTNLQGLSKNLSQAATDAGSLPDANSFIKNKALPGILGGAVKAVGAIFELIEGRKAQKQIMQEILKQDDTMTAIMTEIGNEMGLAYERQRTKDGERLTNLTIEYKNNLNGRSDVFLSFLLVRQIEDSRAQIAALKTANPANAVAAMAKAHKAMVDYVTSGNKSADITSLIASAGSFFSAAQSSQTQPNK
jgi:hypothetical protein